MDFNEELYDRISSYLAGDMSAEETKAFEKEMAQDEALQQEVEMMRLSNEVLYYDEALDIKATMQEDFSRFKRNRQIRNGLLAAAVLLVGVSTYILTSSAGEKKSNPTKEQDPAQEVVLPNNESRVELNVDEENITTKNISEPQSKTTNPITSTSEIKPVVMDNTVAVDSEPESTPTTTEPAATIVNQTQPIVQSTPNPCDEVRITAGLKATPTAADAYTGQVRVDMESVKGGKFPYQFKLKGEKYDNAFVKSNLPSGTYQVLIKDAKGCEDNLGTVEVTESRCLSEYKRSYNPTYDGTWEIPFNLEAEKTAELQIISASGQVIVSKELDIFSNPTWDGREDNGSLTAPGLYKFRINYTSESCTGDITILR